MDVRQMLERLIGFPTVSRDSNLDLINFVRDYLDSHGIESNLVPNADGSKANLYATVGPNVEDGVVLSGHTDVVPVDGQPWTTDPFTLTESDGLLYGRGTCDMKAFPAIALALVPQMSELKRPIHFAWSYDEEIGCLGAPDMIREIAANVPKPRAVIVGEPTSMKVLTAHKGMTSYRTVVTGHEAHSSQTHRGVSAVMTAAKLIDKLSNMAHGRMNGVTDDDFDPPYTTIHVGVMNGGTAGNIISRHAEFIWDVRHVPGDDPVAIREEFTSWCDNEVIPAMQAVAPETGIETVITATTPALRHDAENAAEQIAKDIIGGEQRSGKASYATEAGQFQEAGFATIICGPGSIDQAHQPNEFISIDQLEQGTVFVEKLIATLSQE